jgi:hypothetical protein
MIPRSAPYFSSFLCVEGPHKLSQQLVVSLKFAKELGNKHKSRIHKSSPAYLTSMDGMSGIISVKVDR